MIFSLFPSVLQQVTILIRGWDWLLHNLTSGIHACMYKHCDCPNFVYTMDMIFLSKRRSKYNLQNSIYTDCMNLRFWYPKSAWCNDKHGGNEWMQLTKGDFPYKSPLVAERNCIMITSAVLVTWKVHRLSIHRWGCVGTSLYSMRVLLLSLPLEIYLVTYHHCHPMYNYKWSTAFTRQEKSSRLQNSLIQYRLTRKIVWMVIYLIQELKHYYQWIHDCSDIASIENSSSVYCCPPSSRGPMGPTLTSPLSWGLSNDVKIMGPETGI